MTEPYGAVRHDPSPCPGCGEPLDVSQAVDLQPHMPQPGDCSVCMICGAVSRFTNDLKLRLITAQELLELRPEERRELALASMAVSRFIRQRGRRN